MLVVGLAASAVAQPAASTKKADGSTEPASVAVAAKALDLRTFPVLTGAKELSPATLGMLSYQVKQNVKSAFDFQKQQLQRLGFQELPGGYAAATSQSANFSKAGFRVAVSVSDGGDGMVYVSVVNGGNVPLEKLPVPKGVKPFHPEAMPGSYLAEGKVLEVAEACRKLLLAAGWEPYGRADTNATSADMQMHFFKRNAIRLQSWVSTAPAEGGKTMIRYSTELLQADLPLPPEIENPQYTDMQKTLRYDAPLDQTDKILAFYQTALPKQGWTATTDRPVKDDQKKTQFLIFRNDAKDLLSLDLASYNEIVRVKVSYQSAAEVAEEEKRFKEKLEREKEKQLTKDKPTKPGTPIKPEKTKPATPDVELPAEVNDLLKKALQEVEKAKPKK
jgi:hypothetical protein